MKIKLDENLPVRLEVELAELGHDVHTVMSEGIAGHDDDDVWARATGEGRFLITQDLDFSDIRRFQPGMHPGILVVRLRDPGRKALILRVLAVDTVVLALPFGVGAEQRSDAITGRASRGVPCRRRPCAGGRSRFL